MRHKKLNSGESATVLEENDDFEVLEIDDEETQDNTTGADYSQVKKKLRPNDRITVTYEN
jgi:predicted RNA-binding protein